LLFHLPANFRYKIIFMERDIEEILISQEKMLGKRKRKDTVHFQLVKSFTDTIKKAKSWANEQQNVDILFISYQDAINNPTAIAKKVNDFLGGSLKKENMIKAVDKKLYRNKSIK